ncbi:MAG: hypothetical protein ACI9UN_000647 [Granulosicoccus sp.]|jgi:hypothetical protein
MSRNVIINSFRCVTLISYRNIRTLFSALIIIASQLGPANISADDLRLFYLSDEYYDEEREKSISEQTFSQSSQKNRGTTNDDSISKPRLSSANLVTAKPTVNRLRFNGIVRNGNRFLLLVNDLPCETVSEELSNQAVSSKDVRCRHINQKYYSFKLLPDEDALHVYKGTKYIATLLVGEGL